MSDYTPGEFALPNPSPGSGLVKDVDGKPVAPMPTAQNPGPQTAAPEPEYTYKPNTASTPTTASLRYPSDIGNATDYMIFEFFKYRPPFGAGSGAGAANPSREAYNQTAQLTEKAGLNQIILYMPEDVSVSYKGDWTPKKFSNIGAGLLASAGGVAGGNFKEALDKITTTAGSGFQRLPAQLGAQAVSAIVGSITGESISQSDIFSSIGGQILNPNTELIFGGQELRTFTFTYKLVAYNKPEVDKIRSIIQTFKKAMLPSFSTDTLKYNEAFAAPDTEKKQETPSYDKGIGFIKNPSLVQPYFMSGTGLNRYLPRFKPCTITDFDVNYTADGVYATYEGGSPVAATITISLIETKLVYLEDIDDGF